MPYEVFCLLRLVCGLVPVYVSLFRSAAVEAPTKPPSTPFPAASIEVHDAGDGYWLFVCCLFETLGNVVHFLYRLEVCKKVG